MKVTYHFGGDDAGTETFETTFDVLYDVDEGNTGDVDLTGSGERTTIDLNGKWQFGGKGLADASAMDFDDSGWDTVTVPHDWNAKTGDGVNARENGTFWYRRTLELTAEEAEKYNERSAFLEFYSVGMDSHVYLNGAEVGAHKGGWSAFKIDVTGKFQEGENVIAVSANNERKLNGDIAPLHGDFDNASGMNRDVKLVLTSQVHIDQLDHGSHGVYMVPQRADGWSESNDIWDVDVTARIANDTIKSRDVTVKATISHPTEFDDVLGMEEKGLLRFDPEDMYDPNGTAVGEGTVTISAIRESATEAALSVRVEDPELWNGVESPYRYVAKIEVFDGNEADPDKLVDSYETMIGFRYYDAVRTDEGGYGMNDEDGFYLNGKPYLLRGMAFHEDWPGFGRALSKEFIAKDVEVLYEMGATWTRVSHYPHDEYCYELLSQYGIACSAEIPLVDGVSLVNPDGSYTDSKKEGILSPSFKETTLDLFRDMVKQNYNQPAILGWLMQNELGGGTYGQGSGADAKAAQSEMITALHNLSHELDPGRKTVMAMSLPHCYEYDADWLLWNSYPGWYDGNTTGIGYFIDGYATGDREGNDRPTGASEYGAGVNPFHQTDYIRGETSFDAWSGTGKAFHPESYGNDRNEQSLREINARPFMWATGGWIMFDFSASARNEGGRIGTNDKGLVYKARPGDEGFDYDGDPESLLLRKDGFYLYKANLRRDIPLTYIAEQRYNPRLEKNIIVTVYSNAPVVELYLNGELVGRKEETPHAKYTGRNTVDPETSSCIFKFNVTLADGENHVEARGLDLDGKPHSDAEVDWRYGDLPELDIQSEVFDVNNGGKAIMLTGVGDAKDIDELVAPLNPAVEHTYRVLTADQQPVTEGPITDGMLLEVKWGDEIKVYTFRQPYISAKKPVTVDGAETADAANVVDFKENTFWSAGDTAAHDLTIDLGKCYVLSEIKVNWANENAQEPTSYKVLTSNDGKVWNTVADRSANKSANEGVQDELQSYGRYVKLAMAEGSSPRISEIEIYGWMLSLVNGEDRIFVNETERTICVPTDIPDFHTGGLLTAGMSIENVEPLLVFEGNGKAVHENDVDYSLDFEHSRYVITDSVGRKIPFRFEGFTGKQKPAGPFELSIGKPATCSSIQNDQYVATNVTTIGSGQIRWNAKPSGASGLNEWVMVDLGAMCELDAIDLRLPSKATGMSSDRYYTFFVEIGDSADGPFTEVYDGRNNTDKSGIFLISDTVKGKQARYIRVTVTGNSSGYQPGVDTLYVKGWAVPPTTYNGTLNLKLDGADYGAHGKTFTLRQNGRVIAEGSGDGSTIAFTGLLDGLYDIYDGDVNTGHTLNISGADGSAELNFFVVTYESEGSDPVTLAVAEGSLLVRTEDPTNGNKTFEGWFSDEGMTQAWDFENDVVTGPLTLYAKWTGDKPHRPSRPSGSGSSSGSSSSSSAEKNEENRVTSSKSQNGTFEVDTSRAKEGDTVTITTKPNAGYEVDSVKVTAKDGSIVRVTEEDDGVYTFTMPNKQVEIDVAFRLAGAAPEPAVSYSDVANSDWFSKAADYVTAKGIMSGYNGNFMPNTALNRGMIAQILYNLGGGTRVSAQTFPDVSASDWYADAVAWVASKGVMSGYGFGLFGAEDPITREQLAVTLYQYAGVMGYDTAPTAELSAFADGGNCSNWAMPAMRWAVASGLLSGKSGGRLDPQGMATRAEVAAVLMNFVEQSAK